MANDRTIRTVTLILETHANNAAFIAASEKVQELNKELKEAVKELDRIRKKNGEQSEEYKKQKALIDDKTKELKAANAQQIENLKTIELEKQSLQQLLTLRKGLRETMRYAAPDSKEFQKAAAGLKDVNAQITRLKTLAGEAGSSFLDMGKFSSGIGKLFAAFGLGIGVLNGVSAAARKAWDNIKQVSELYSDIRKTTDLGVFDTARLTSNLARMNTRTDITQRAEYAVIAGRMGMRGVTEITDFVREADKIVVSLGDSIKGSADEIVTKIAKIVNAFGTDTENAITFSEAMERVGSTLNRVAAEGVASEEWQVDYLYRTAAIGRALKMSVQNMQGYGTVLEETGNTVEVSGTAVSQFFGLVAKNAEDFAKRAGMSVEEFIYLLETDANQALKLVLKSIKEGAISNTELIKSFSELGIDGERSTKVILSLANNLDKLEEKQRLANDEFERNTSLTQEYQKKQQTIGASIEKIWNGITRAVTNSKVVLYLQDIFGWLSKIADVSQAEVMKEQITQLHILEGRLRDSNTAWEEKREILDQLRSEYPGLFADIENEIDLQRQLTEQMQLANEVLLERIAIQKSQEKIGELAGKQLTESENIDQYTFNAQKLIDDIKRTLPESVVKNLPPMKGVSSEALSEYASYLKLHVKNVEGSEIYAPYGIIKIETPIEKLFHIISDIEKAEKRIVNYQKEIDDETASVSKKIQTVNSALGKGDSSYTAPQLTKQDYLATIASVATGGTTYRNFDAATKTFLEGEAIDPDTLKLMNEVLDKEKEVIARGGGAFTSEGLRSEFQGNIQYQDYSAFLGAKSGSGPTEDDLKAAQKAASEKAKREATMQKALDAARKTGEDNLRKSLNEGLSEVERRRKEIAYIFDQATGKLRDEYLEAAGDGITSAERDKMEQVVAFLEDVKNKMLDAFDDKFHQDMVDKIFDLTATDEEKAFAALDKKFKEPIKYWTGIRDNAADIATRDEAEKAITNLTAAYERDFGALVEKYKPDAQKAREKKERQIYDATRYYAMPEAYDGTDTEIAQARTTSELLIALRADTYESMQELGREFLASEYTSFLKFLQDKRSAQVKADKEELEARIQLYTQISSSAQQLSSASTQAELQSNQIAMNKELEAAEGNERKQDQIRRKYAKREADLKVKQAMVDYFAGMVSLIAKSWGAFGIGTGLSMAAYTAMATIQIESLKEAANAFAEGKYDTIRANDGRTYTARIQSDANRTQFVNEPTYFTGQNALVGERMPEVIISGPDTAFLRRMRPDVIQAIASLPGAKGFAAGRYPDDMKNTSASSGGMRVFGEYDKRLMRILEGIEEKMDTPFTGVIVADEKNMINVQKALNNLSARQKKSRTF